MPSARLEDRTEDARWIAAQWFAAPRFAKPGIYEKEQTRIVLNRSCETSPGRWDPEKIIQSVEKGMGLDATVQYPRDVRIVTLTQFWKKAGRHYQMGMNWTGAEPASYEMDFFASSDPALQEGVDTLMIPGQAPRVRLSVSAALQLIAETLAAAKQDGAEEGARALNVQHLDASGEAHIAEAQNGRLIHTSRPGLNCNYAHADKALKCACAFDR